jgi:hypothetical protein
MPAKAFLVVLACTFVASGQVLPKPDWPATRKLMPKEQLPFVEKADEVVELFDKAQIESNGLKKFELERTRNEKAKALVTDLTKQWQSKGFAEWVMIYDESDYRSLRCHYRSTISWQLLFDGMSADVKAVIRELKPGDAVALTIAPEKKAQSGSPAESSYVIPGTAIKSAKAITRK